MKKIILALIAIGGLFLGLQASAEKNERRQPPPEAFEVCEGLSEGDIVSIITPHGDIIEASCKLMHEKLVAVPEGKAKK